MSMEGVRRGVKVRRQVEEGVEAAGVEVDAQLGEEMEEAPSWACLAFSRWRMWCGAADT